MQLFMFICWTIIGLSFMFCYLHLPSVKDENSEDKNKMYYEMAEACTQQGSHMYNKLSSVTKKEEYSSKTPKKNKKSTSKKKV